MFVCLAGLSNRPDGLKYADVKVISNYNCGNSYNLEPDQIYESNLCAYTRGTDACQGDSGGTYYLAID